MHIKLVVDRPINEKKKKKKKLTLVFLFKAMSASFLNGKNVG